MTDSTSPSQPKTQPQPQSNEEQSPLNELDSDCLLERQEPHENSEPQDNQAPSISPTQSTDERPKNRRVFNTMALLLLVVMIVIVSIYMNRQITDLDQQWGTKFQLIQTQLSEQKNNESLLQTTQQQVKANQQQWQLQQQTITELQKTQQQQVQKQSTKNQQLEKTILQTASQISDKQAFNPTRWQMAEALYLLQIAQQRLVLQQDVKGVLNIITTADQMLRDIQDVGLILIRQQLNADRLALKQVSEVDQVGMYTRLQALSGQIQHFTLVVNKRELDLPLAESSQGFLASIKDYIKVSKIQPDSPLNYDLTAFRLAQQQLQLYLEQIKWAIIHRDNKVYQDSLTQAIDLLQRYFFKQISYEHFLSELTQLQATNLQLALPELLKTIELFQHYLYKVDQPAISTSAVDVAKPSDDSNEN